jgi:hypothetical protein
VGRYLPRELRIKLYNDVIALRRGGLMYRGIIGEVWRRYRVRRLGIESTGPKLHYLRGTIFYDPRTGKQYTHNKDAYVIYIRASSNTNFYRYVGFAMTRRQARLENYVKRNTGAPTLPQPFPNPSSK